MEGIGMALIKASVGFNGTNEYKDAKRIQILLNQNRHYSAHPEITVDGIVGPKTIRAIKVFQSKVLHTLKPDGRVDPDGNTLKRLIKGSVSGDQPVAPPPKSENESKTSKVPQITMRFPLNKRPKWGYKSGGRYYGAKRKGGRLHACCDLLASEETAIYAVADGKVKAYYPFYSGTDAVEVEHTGGFVVRYGEISKLAPGVKIGSTVKRGQHIAYVGKLHAAFRTLQWIGVRQTHESAHQALSKTK
jgi:murein DD-endopeptidase MepM/ murein hydrolase activator NlpD